MPHSLSKPRKGFRHHLAAPSWPVGPPRPTRPRNLSLAIAQWKRNADLMSRFLLIVAVGPQLEQPIVVTSVLLRMMGLKTGEAPPS